MCLLLVPWLIRVLTLVLVLAGASAGAVPLSPDLAGPPLLDRSSPASSQAAEPAMARLLLQQACARGEGTACVAHALTTLRGEGTPRDGAAGLGELRDACERHPESACGRAIGGLVEQGTSEGGAPEWEQMALFAQRGCEAGDGLSCRLLGEAFASGRGVSQELERALALYVRACDAGEGRACAAQALLLPATEAPLRATGLFARGCALGSAEACRLLVLATLDPQAEQTDAPVRRVRFQQACERGVGMGCLALYDALRHEPAEPEQPLRLPGLLKRACRLGETAACQFLDSLSRQVEPQCARGSASACGVLGVLLVSPPSLPEETESGLSLLHQSCQTGDVASCGVLEARTLPSAQGMCRAR